MLNRKILIILLLKLHLALALNSANFCTIKQKVCKGYYDTKQNYHTKCGLVECSDERFSFKCSNDICTNNKTECFKYKKLKSNMLFSNWKTSCFKSYDERSVFRRDFKISNVQNEYSSL
jgi:hypothetical protein